MPQKKSLTKNILNFMQGFKSAILAEWKNCQNGTFEHVHEIQKIFLLKDIFWSKVPQVQDLCQKAEIFSKKIH